jgi:hypothetical protein
MSRLSLILVTAFIALGLQTVVMVIAGSIPNLRSPMAFAEMAGSASVPFAAGWAATACFTMTGDKTADALTRIKIFTVAAILVSALMYLGFTAK